MDFSSEYGVFVSFKKEDTGRTFVSHLFRSLDQNRIQTFKDEKQQTGDGRISLEIVRAIKNSNIAVVVISENYVSSVWCLEVLAMITEGSMVTIPVYYEVDPGDLTRPTGKFADDLRRHEETANPMTVYRWRKALWRLENTGSRFCSRDWEDDSKMLDNLIISISFAGDSTQPVVYQNKIQSTSKTSKRRGFFGAMKAVSASSVGILMQDNFEMYFSESLPESGETEHVSVSLSGSGETEHFRGNLFGSGETDHIPESMSRSGKTKHIHERMSGSGKTEDVPENMSGSGETEHIHESLSRLEKTEHIPGSLSRSGKTKLEIYAHEDTSITSNMSNELPFPLSDVSNGLIGMDRHKKVVYRLLDLECKNQVRIIGIWGMEGIGKTTLAESVFEDISQHFQHHCFITNVKNIHQNRISPSLLEHLIRTRSSNDNFDALKPSIVNRNMLLIVDAVHDNEQLKDFVKISHWLGPGSRVIMTSKDKNSLISCGVKYAYEMGCLRYEEALQLFSLFAFKRSYPPIGFQQFSDRAVHFAGRLPLALKVLGSLLYGKDEESWKITLRKLEGSQDNGSRQVFNYIEACDYLPRRPIELEQYAGADEEEYSPSYHMLL